MAGQLTRPEWGQQAVAAQSAQQCASPTAGPPGDTSETLAAVVADVSKLRRAIFALRDALAQQRVLIAALRQDAAAAYGLLRLLVDRDRPA